MIRILLFLIFCILLASCLPRASFPPSNRECIASFPLNMTTTDEQIFEINEIRTKKDHLKCSYPGCRPFVGPYSLSLCMDDEKDASRGARVVVSFISNQIDEKKDSSNLSYSEKICSGWILGNYWHSTDFDFDQKVTVSFQILRDEKGYLAAMTNPRLIFTVGNDYEMRSISNFPYPKEECPAYISDTLSRLP